MGEGEIFFNLKINLPPSKLTELYGILDIFASWYR